MILHREKFSFHRKAVRGRAGVWAAQSLRILAKDVRECDVGGESSASFTMYSTTKALKGISLSHKHTHTHTHTHLDE